MSSSWADLAYWPRQLRRLRRSLDARIALGRWYPQLPLALMIAPLGLLLVDAAIRRDLGIGVLSLELAELESRMASINIGASGEAAVGAFVLAMSVGILLRSRLAWLSILAVLILSIALRLLPGRPADPGLTLYLAFATGVLFAYRHSFARRSLLTSGAFALISLASFAGWATFGTLRLGEEFRPPVRDIPTALYVAVVTFSSVGFGDFVPISPEARMFTISMILLGILVGAGSLSAVIVPLVSGRLQAILGGKEDRVERIDHYVVVGESPLARNSVLELEKRGQHATLVLEKPNEEDFFRTRDVVIGDPTDLSVLRTAGAEKAKAVLALSVDDAENGFVVLGVNEIDATIQTVAALNDPNNHSRLQRTQPSLLLSLQVLGGELLAMALTGERVDPEMLSRALQLRGVEERSGK